MSVSMMLTEGLRRRLEARFACPVLDLYSMNEVGPIAVYDARASGHVVLQPRLYVEVLDRDGRPAPVGGRGEVCVTGGFNFCLPLLRYRTGDFATLSQFGGEPVLREMSGRKPVRFRTTGGGWLNNIDVSHALKGLPLAQFGLHQDAGGLLTLRLPRESAPYAETARNLLRSLLGDPRISLATVEAGDKILQYTSDLDGGLIE
jgi:phenylacetate-CoA ligase